MDDLSCFSTSSTYIIMSPFREYSDFFKSGFRAFTNRDRKQPSETASLDTPSMTPKTTFSDTSERQPRSASVQITPRETAERRRSSFPSFTSHWLEPLDHHSTTNFFNESSTAFLRSSASPADLRDFSEFWIVGGGLYTVPAINERYIPFFLILAGTKILFSYQF